MYTSPYPDILNYRKCNSCNWGAKLHCILSRETNWSYAPVRHRKRFSFHVKEKYSKKSDVLDVQAVLLKTFSEKQFKSLLQYFRCHKIYSSSSQLLYSFKYSYKYLRTLGVSLLLHSEWVKKGKNIETLYLICAYPVSPSVEATLPAYPRAGCHLTFTFFSEWSRHDSVGKRFHLKRLPCGSEAQGCHPYSLSWSHRCCRFVFQLIFFHCSSEEVSQALQECINPFLQAKMGAFLELPHRTGADESLVLGT